MTMFMEKAMRRTVLVLAVTAAMLASMATPAQGPHKIGKKEQKEKKETPQYAVSGRDPKAFVDAAALFAPPSQKRLDDLAAKIALADLETSFKTGDPWSPQLWVQLDRLRAVGVSPRLVEALRHTAQKMEVADRPLRGSKVLPTASSGAIATGFALLAVVVGGLMLGYSEGGTKRRMAGVIFGAGIAIGALSFLGLLFASRENAVEVAAAKQPFEQGNGYYEAGRFDKAVESYRVALKDYPAFWDAWNNMALAEMHCNNDLVALFLLSALTKNNPRYAGGSINLSVCLERLGQDATAYEIAAAVTNEHSQMPMANYNMAWFENSRGKYEVANTYLSKALESVSDYTVSKWLRTINSMESGRTITADELKALPPGDQSQGIPKILTRPVKLATADAYSGNTLVDEIPEGSQLVISEKAGDWYAFYWPVDNAKRRLWIHQASLGSQTFVAHNDLNPFLGTWNSKWGNVTERGIRIEEVNGRPKVTMDGWRVWDEKLENGVLSYRKKGGASNWEFVYTLTSKANKIELEVFSVHDQARFSGELSK